MGNLYGIAQRHMDAYGVREAALARRMGVPAQTLNTWKNRGVRKLPEREALEALARETRTPYEDVLAAALRDTGYLDGGEQDHAKSTAAITRAGGSPAPAPVEDLDGRRRKHPRHLAYGPDHFNNDEATPPSRGDLSPEARPDLYVDEAAQHREHTARENNTDDGGSDVE